MPRPWHVLGGLTRCSADVGVLAFALVSPWPIIFLYNLMYQCNFHDSSACFNIRVIHPGVTFLAKHPPMVSYFSFWAII